MYLPAGCKIQLDRVAQGLILENLKHTVGGTFGSLVQELRSLGKDVGLLEFLQQTGLSLEDVYRSPGWTWTRLRREAGLPTPTLVEGDNTLLKGVARLIHTDDAIRLAFLRDVMKKDTPPPASGLTEAQRRILLALHFTLQGTRTGHTSFDQALGDIWTGPGLVGELRELFSALEDRATHLTFPLSGSAWHDVPLSIHASYSLDEILTAFGEMTLEHPDRIREGVRFNETTKSDLFFVTLEKSEKGYSPTTMYKDYAISPELFHWESQSMTSQASPTGQRYINHRERGTNILIFARRAAKVGGRTAPYIFLGPADYVSHERERPIAFVWRLRKPMPADFFREAKVATG